MRAYLMRHGETEYKQHQNTLAEANDLTPKGERDIIESSHDLATAISIRETGPVSIQSSPFGRALYSARLAREVLISRGIKMGDIVLNLDLREVDNFDWILFSALVNGGEVSYEQERFRVDNSLTNPQALNPPEFFRTDSAHNLSARAKRALPQSYL